MGCLEIDGTYEQPCLTPEGIEFMFSVKPMEKIPHHSSSASSNNNNILPLWTVHFACQVRFQTKGFTKDKNSVDYFNALEVRIYESFVKYIYIHKKKYVLIVLVYKGVLV